MQRTTSLLMTTIFSLTLAFTPLTASVAQEESPMPEEKAAIAAPAPEAEADIAPVESPDGASSDTAIKHGLAREIIRLSPVEGDLSKTIQELSMNVPADKRILFKSIVNRSIKVDRLNAAAEVAFVEIFTLDELESMRDYYASEQGQSIRKKMGAFEERIQPLMDAMVEDALFNVQNSSVDFTGRR